MGYRNDLGFLITLNEKSAEEIYSALKERYNKENGCELEYSFSPNVSSKENLLSIIIEQVKLYDFEDRTIAEILRDMIEAEEIKGFHYIRLGDDLGDIEEAIWGEVDDYYTINRYFTEPYGLEKMKGGK